MNDEGGTLVGTGDHLYDTADPLADTRGPLTEMGGPLAVTKSLRQHEALGCLKDLWLTQESSRITILCFRPYHAETADDGRSQRLILDLCIFVRGVRYIPGERRPLHTRWTASISLE